VPDPIEELPRRIVAAAADAAVVAVGLGLLGINRVQVARRELQARLGRGPGGPSDRP